jgi:hypothetical protein
VREACSLVCIAMILNVSLAGQTASAKKKPIVPDKAYTFMGLTPGEAKADAIATVLAMDDANGHFKDSPCSAASASPLVAGLEVCCYLPYTYIEGEAPSFCLDIIDGKVGSFTYYLWHQKYESIVEAMVDKFGAPKTSQRQTVENRMGATFSSRFYLWTNSVSRIEAREYTDTLEKSSIEIEDPQLVGEFNRRLKAGGPKI